MDEFDLLDWKRRVFELYTALPISYVDCYNAALMEARKRVDLYSYDSDFDDIPSITRREPPEQP